MWAWLLMLLHFCNTAAWYKAKRTEELNKRLFVILSVWAALQRHCTENAKQIFAEKKLRGLIPNFHIHVSLSDLYIPTIDLPILLQQNRWTDRGIFKSLLDT